MKKILAFVIALILVLGCVLVLVPAADSNLISNGDFESSTLGGSVANWSGTYYRVDDPLASGQGKVMKCNGVSYFHDAITIKANTYYRYSAKIYREGTTGYAYVDMLDVPNQGLITGTNAGTNEAGRWVAVSVIFNSGEHTSMVPRLVADQLTEPAYYDDVELTELSFPQKGMVGTAKAAFTVASDATAATFAATEDALYMTELFDCDRSGFSLLSVKVIGDYQLELKFNENLNTTTCPAVTQINAGTNIKVGMAWVDNTATGQQAFEDVTDDAIEGTVALGETDNILIWTVSSQTSANAIPTLLEDTKEGYTRKFFLFDNGCGYNGAGAIGALQNVAGAGLCIPDSNIRGDGTREYLFMNITQPQEISLVRQISDKEVIWKYSSYETAAISNGTEHIVTFLSSDNKYQLRAVLTQRDGDGPIEFNQYITGLTEGISVAYSDIVSANIAVQTDGDATLYRFSRSRVNNGEDPYFSQGVLTDALSAGSSVFSSVENYYTVKNSAEEDITGSILPYQVLDIDGTHGVYFGHYWSFGKILVRMNDSNEVAFTAYLGDKSNRRIVRDRNEELSIPGFFIGTYEGSVDDGSNQMKDWFWDHKMTRTLYENETEPYIEIGVLGDRVAGIDTLFDIWPDLADYVNILKLDYGWTIPDNIKSRENPDLENDWVPESAAYGKEDGSIDMGIYAAIQENLLTDQSENEVFFSLYMADTFQGVDIGTKEGREKQLEALKVRMRPADNNYGIGYDYWRSDYEVEQSYDYDDHEGLLYILDEMIKYSEDFRYEHCMGGGTLKDFTTLERMTFMTTEDTSLPLNHRMSLYANTYMINPLQLKADISMGATSRDYGKVTGYGNILESGEPGYTDETYVKYALRTGMLGASMVSFSAEGYQYGNNMAIIKEHYDLYNNTHREILRNTDVYHILSAPTGWDYADWDGIEYYNPELNKGVVQLFKENENAPDAKTIVLDGLDENTMYALTFIDRTEQNTVMSGADLMTTGITVTGMDTQYASELIYIEPNVEAVIGDTQYAHMSDALSTAEDGQTVMLVADVSNENVMVPAGITLDLNGHDLTADGVVAYGNVKDSSEGDGGIVIDKNDTLQLQPNNTMMPLYDSAYGGYRFFTCSVTQLNRTDVCKFGFRINMDAKAYELLKNAANADAQVSTSLVVTVDDKEYQPINYTFQAATVADYATQKLANPEKNLAITLTVRGFDAIIGNMICTTSTPSFTSSTNVSITPLTNATAAYYIRDRLNYGEIVDIWE